MEALPFLAVAVAIGLAFGIFTVMSRKKSNGSSPGMLGPREHPHRGAWVAHLARQGWVVGGQSDSLWSYEEDESRNRKFNALDHADCQKAYDEDAMFGYVDRHFMRFGKHGWEDHQIGVEVQLYWETHSTEPEVKLRLSTRVEDDAPSGMEQFDSGNAAFDGLFATRFATPATARRIQAGRDRLAPVAQFVANRKSHLVDMTVADAIEASFVQETLAGDDPAANVTAFLEDCDVLALAIETAIDPSYVKAAPPDESVARYISVQVLTTCPKCKAGLPLNGPRREVPCTNCLNTISLAADFWDLLEDPDKNYRQGAGGFNRNFSTDFSWSVERPLCHSCKEELDSLDASSDGPRACASCGAANDTYPAPPWLRDVVPRVEQVFGAERDASHDLEGLALEPQDQPKPVAMSCPACGGGLTITAQMERTVECEYCQVDVFLPDALWKRLHPVKVATRWHVRLAART